MLKLPTHPYGSMLPPTFISVNFFSFFEHKMKMGSRNTLWFVLVLILAGCASSDVDQDRAECADKLIGLSPCLSYVGGQAKAPTPDCCSGLKQVLDKSKKCLCILIKDKDDPKLGLKINATLAATLPTTCHASSNVTECIDLLHLAPNSADAKMFRGFANITNTAGSSSAPKGSSAEMKSDGGRRKENLVIKMVGAFPFLCLVTCPLIFHM